MIFNILKIKMTHQDDFTAEWARHRGKVAEIQNYQRQGDISAASMVSKNYATIVRPEPLASGKVSICLTVENVGHAVLLASWGVGLRHNTTMLPSKITLERSGPGRCGRLGAPASPSPAGEIGYDGH